MKYCKYCNKEFNNGLQLGGHIPRCRLNPNIKFKEIVFKKHICKYCNREFEKGLQLGGHIIRCTLNPSSNNTRINASLSLMGDKNPTKKKEVRDKISKTILEKSKNGTWHLSFSKSRTHEYNGIKLHGTWELNFAKYLDKNNIKWKRPNEKFYYKFNGKNSYYTPDFYLIDENIFIEIKGYETDRDRAKWKYFPYNLKIIKGKDLYKLNIIKKYKDV